MYKDSTCRSSPQPPPSTNVAEIAPDIPITETTFPEDHSTTHAHVATLEDDEEDGFSCPSESSSESEYEVRSRPSTTSTTSTSSSSAAGAPAVGAPGLRRKKRLAAASTVQRTHYNSDVRLLRKIGYIASRVRFLGKIYGDFKLVNPYSPAKQKRLLQDIILKHSIIDPERDSNTTKIRSSGTASVRTLTPASSIASSYCCLPQPESSFDDDSVTGTVRRKSSTTITKSGAIILLEDLLIQLYEDPRNKVTVIRRRRSRRSSSGAAVIVTGTGATKVPRNHLIIMTSKTASSSVERLLQLDNEDEVGGVGAICGAGSADKLSKGTLNHVFNANMNISSQQQQQQQRSSGNAFLQPTPGDDNLKRRRASDCTPHQPLSNQLQITLKNNNCTKFPLHRGSCGAAGDHLLAASSIANRQTLILSKSCGNVDTGIGQSNPALYGSTDLRNLSGSAVTAGGGTGGVYGGGSSVATSTAGATGAGGSQFNGNNEYSIVQLNNTIIQCHFNDDDFRALVKDLKRKVEYTERMNWLCKYQNIVNYKIPFCDFKNCCIISTFLN